MYTSVEIATVCRFPLLDESHLHTVWTGTVSCGQSSRVPKRSMCAAWTALVGPLLPLPLLMGQLQWSRMQHAYFVPVGTRLN